jgi:hypothetical protein
MKRRIHAGETYQRSEIVVLQGMEIISIQRVRDFPYSPIGKRDSSREATHVFRYDTFLTVWRIHSPVPVRKPDSVRNLQGFVTGLTDRVLIGNVHSAIMENLLE